jgi:L-fuculose-phosphate aldolase
MQHSGHGNLSARLDDERLVITSTGSLRSLGVADFAVVTVDGQLLDGRLEPTTAEIVAMHTGVYRARPHAQAVIHTHSPQATAFALAHEPLPCAYEALLRHGVAEPIPVAAWAPRGSAASVEHIVEQLVRHPATPAVLLANHGLLASGAGPLQTAQLVIAMEEAAGMTLAARALGGAQPFPAGALEQEQAHMARFAATA